MSLREQIDREFGGILPTHEVFYLLAARNAAAKSVEHYNAFVNRYHGSKSADAACYEFFSAIIQAASLSTLFWPNPKKKTAQARASRMREHFDALSVLRIKDRTLRNRISHIDEYLDTFCESKKNGQIIDGFVGDIGACREPHMLVLRMVDPIKRRAIVHGYEFDYSGFFESVAQIGNDAEQMLHDGGCLRSQLKGD